MLKRLWNRLLSKLSTSNKSLSLTDYWRERARKHGKHSVLNMTHKPEEFDAVTEYQKEILFPFLQSELKGTESTILDFGCGPGRFTVGLAELIGGKAIGVDITKELLDLAPKSPLVTYQCIGMDKLPFPDDSFDIVWSCLVLGGVPDDKIEHSIVEINRVLRPGGVFFFVENTADDPSSYYWTFRNEQAYIKLTSFCCPDVIGRYEDIGQTISIFSGRKI